MKLKNMVNDAINETAERVRTIMKNDNYNFQVDKKGVEVKKLRPTRHTIKWQSKNH